MGLQVPRKVSKGAQGVENIQYLWPMRKGKYNFQEGTPFSIIYNVKIINIPFFTWEQGRGRVMHSYLLNGYIKIGKCTLLVTYLGKLKRRLFRWPLGEVERLYISYVLHLLISMCFSLRGGMRIGRGIREL